MHLDLLKLLNEIQEVRNGSKKLPAEREEPHVHQLAIEPVSLDEMDALWIDIGGGD